MRTIIISILTLLTFDMFGQTPPPQYSTLIDKADSLFKLKDYKKSAYTFSSAFMTFGNKGHMQYRYEAARAWSLINVTDSAFDCLTRISKSQSAAKMNFFMDRDRLIREKDFANLHSDKRWSALLDSINLNKNPNEYSDFKPITMRVLNKLNERVSVFLFNSPGKEVFYFDLQPLEDHIQWTFTGDKWIIRRVDDGTSTKVTEFTVTKDHQLFDTNGQVTEDK